MNFNYREECARLLFQSIVGKAKSPEELDPCHLKPDQIVGMVGDTHLIRLGIADPEVRLDPLAASSLRHGLRLNTEAAVESTQSRGSIPVPPVSPLRGSPGLLWEHPFNRMQSLGWLKDHSLCLMAGFSCAEAIPGMLRRPPI